MAVVISIEDEQRCTVITRAIEEDVNQPAVYRGSISDYEIEGPITMDSEHRDAKATGNKTKGKGVERKRILKVVDIRREPLLVFNHGENDEEKWRIEPESAMVRLW